MKRFLTLILVFAMTLCLSTCSTAKAIPNPDYIQLLQEAALTGDSAKGRMAEELQAKLLSENPGLFTPVSYDDLFLLSKFICADAGQRMQSNEFLMCIGEVILNRVLSPEFPNSIEEVIYDKGQYDFADSEEFKQLLPNKACVSAALRLLQGERLMKASVVFKSDMELGKVYAAFCDRVQGFTYFCESPNSELYKIQNYPQRESSYQISASDSPNVSVNGGSIRDYKDSSIIVIAEKHA